MAGRSNLVSTLFKGTCGILIDTNKLKSFCIQLLHFLILFSKTRKNSISHAYEFNQREAFYFHSTVVVTLRVPSGGFAD